MTSRGWFARSAAQSRKLDRNPCGTAARPCSFTSLESVASDRGFPRMLGNTSPVALPSDLASCRNLNGATAQQHVLQHELGLQRAPELPVGGVEAVRVLEAVEPLQGGGRGGVAGGEGRVELADAIPLLGDETEVDRPRWRTGSRTPWSRSGSAQ